MSVARPVVSVVASDEEDFRVRAARGKRERMRLRLQNAAIDVFRSSSLVHPPVVEDVIQAAAVSRGTFYNYYRSLDELLFEIGQQVAGDVLQTYRVMVAGTNDVAARLLMGPVLSMVHAGMEPARASITARLDFFAVFSRESEMKKILSSVLVQAQGTGVIHYECIVAATDYVVGSSLEGMRRMARLQTVDETYIRTVSRMIGCGLGMPSQDACNAVTASWKAIYDNPAKPTWWCPDKLSGYQLSSALNT
jgi:AcrR family transcriptional regulator